MANNNANININIQRLDTFVADSRRLFENFLRDLIEIPTVSTDPTHKKDIWQGANLAASYLQEIGGRVEILETPGHPMVLGYFESYPHAPTITLYHHLDVQPASPIEWRQPPFQFMVTEDGRYLGRGATDDKGPAITALLAVKYAIAEHIPLNIKIIWEMEEEIGSPNFEAAIRSKKQELATDSILVSDTIWISRDKPAITYGLRGLLTATLTLTTGLKDAHSGLVGGAARNPIGELCQVIDQCYDPISGRVKIDGFYEKVREPTLVELAEFEKSGFNIPEFKKDHGLKMLRSEDASKLLQAIWTEPTFEVHGLVGGYTGDGVMTIVPPTAQAKISTRLVPDQKPEEIFHLLKDFVSRINPDVEAELDGMLNPYLSEFTGPYAWAARQAVGLGFGLKPVFTRGGGSIGSVVSMQNTWAVPIVLLGLSLPEHGFHAPNEYFDWLQAAGGIKALVHYFNLISQIPKG